MAVMLMSGIVSANNIHAETYPANINDNITELAFNSGTVKLINIQESTVEYGNRESLNSSYEMNTTTTYTVIYDNALKLPNNDTLDVKVDIRLTNPVGSNKVLFYKGTGEPYLQNKPRVYWNNSGGSKVQWTISLYKEYIDETHNTPNTYEIFTGFEDPDESNYLFSTSGKKIYYRNPSDGNIMNSTNGYKLDAEGLKRINGVIGQDAGGFNRALFLVDIKDSFTFTNQVFLNGTLSVPFFYMPTYNVKYDANSPTGAYEGTVPGSKNGYDANYKIEKNNFTVPGYKFVGWNTLANPTSADEGISFAEGATYKVADSTSTTNSFNRQVPIGDTVTIYAQWEPSYTVRYNANAPEGTSASGSMDNQENLFNDKNTISNNKFTVPGYKFVGWNTIDKPTETNPGIEFANGDTYNVPNSTDTRNDFQKRVKNGDIVDIYAQWEPVYTVRYNDNSPTGAHEGEVANQDNGYNTPNTISENAYTVEGYKFVGWNTTASGDGVAFKEGDPYNVPNPTEADNTFERQVAPGNIVDIFAQWVPSYTVRYVANSPTGSYTGEVADQVNYLKEDNTISENGYAVTGYRFVGWNTVREITEETPGKPMEIGATYNVPNTTDPDNYFEQIVEPNGIVYIYAQWNLQDYKIHYDPNGGSGLMESQLFTILDDTMTSKENIFTRDGYRFKGFLYTGKDGTTKLYTNINDFRNILIDPLTGPEITLVAQWEEIPQPSSPKYVPPVTGVE